MDGCDSISTPMATARLDVDLLGTSTDQTKYHSMIGGLMYLTASRPDIALATFEQISKKRTKNKAKTTKPNTEWKSMVKTKSRQSPSLKKSTKVNPDKSKVKPEAISEEKALIIRIGEQAKTKGQDCFVFLHSQQAQRAVYVSTKKHTSKDKKRRGQDPSPFSIKSSCKPLRQSE
ncbi:hypothetical protein Tco_0162288 [Tanacetum coccineum]